MGLRELSLEPTESTVQSIQSGLLAADSLALLARSTAYDPWSILRLHTGREFAVRYYLDQYEIEHYLPVSMAMRKYGRHRAQAYERILFPGYLFIRPRHCQDRYYASRAPYTFGLLQLVPGKLTELEHSEIERIRRLAAEPQVESWERLHEGQPVRVTDGPLSGMIGVLAQKANSLWIVKNIQMLGRALAVRVEPEWLAAA